MNMLFVGGFGTTEILLIVFVLLLIFGGRKLPELMRGAGRGIKEFKDAMNDTVKDNDKDSAEKVEDKEQK